MRWQYIESDASGGSTTAFHSPLIKTLLMVSEEGEAAVCQEKLFLFKDKLAIQHWNIDWSQLQELPGGGSETAECLRRAAGNNKENRL